MYQYALAAALCGINQGNPHGKLTSNPNSPLTSTTIPGGLCKEMYTPPHTLPFQPQIMSPLPLGDMIAHSPETDR